MPENKRFFLSNLSILGLDSEGAGIGFKRLPLLGIQSIKKEEMDHK